MLKVIFPDCARLRNLYSDEWVNIVAQSLINFGLSSYSETGKSCIS